MLLDALKTVAAMQKHLLGKQFMFFRSKTPNLFLYLYQEFYWRVPFNKRNDAPRYHLKMSEDVFDTVSKVSLTQTPNASLKSVPIKNTFVAAQDSSLNTLSIEANSWDSFETF